MNTALANTINALLLLPAPVKSVTSVTVAVQSQAKVCSPNGVHPTKGLSEFGPGFLLQQLSEQEG